MTYTEVIALRNSKDNPRHWQIRGSNAGYELVKLNAFTNKGNKHEQSN